jgi:NhaP-type Na+/H+ or K+/H+ antiporter
MPDMLTAFALIAMVLIVAALASGMVERGPISFPILFLGIGVALGDRGFGLLSLDAHDRGLEVIGTLSLALVLFLDAVRLRFDEGRRAWLVPALILGPGTLIVIGIIALAAWWLLGVGLVVALILGAVLASTDPVVLRDVVRDDRVPVALRRVLTLEAGMNDVVVLPILLVLAAIARSEANGAGGAGDWALFLARILLIGPAIGFAIGGVGSWAMARLDARMGIRSEHQALYGVGLVLAAYVGGTAVDGDGFLAAFAAGIAVVILDNKLCECFLEYGETTAEMAMLLAFILFGALLSTIVGTVPLVPTLLLAAIVILVARPVAINLVLLPAKISHRARFFVGWFGPRGLASLLFGLLLVHQRVPDAEYLLAITGLVVFVSVIAHGSTATPLAAWYGRQVERETLAEERESTPGGLFGQQVASIPRITPAELAARLATPDPPTILDVRSRSEYQRDDGRIPGSIRVLPDHVTAWADHHPEHHPVVAYCT